MWQGAALQSWDQRIAAFKVSVLRELGKWQFLEGEEID